MHERKIPVACVQLRAHDRKDFTERWPRAIELVDAAGRNGAKLVVLPEGTVPAYVLGHAAVAPAELARASDDLAKIARRHRLTIVYGSAKIIQDRTFNAAIALGPNGDELGFAAKEFLWHFDRLWFAPGQTLAPVDTPVGRLGLLVCADGRIPTIGATLVERGAEMLVMPTAWVTSGRDPAALENIQADLMVNVRARENGVPFVAANKAGVELGAVAYCGKSAIVAADGAFVARGSEGFEETIAAEVRVGAARLAPVAPFALPASQPEGHAAKARIGFTLATRGAEIAAFAAFGALADMDLLIADGPSGDGYGIPIVDVGAQAAGSVVAASGVRIALVDSGLLYSPRGLVAARMAGIDLFIWSAGAADEVPWQIAFARTRAAELRAFVLVLDRSRDRAFAVDPDGAVVAGTFGDYRLASFLYDPARAAATLVAPATDVAEGLRIAEAIRGASMQQPAAQSAAR